MNKPQLLEKYQLFIGGSGAMPLMERPSQPSVRPMERFWPAAHRQRAQMWTTLSMLPGRHLKPGNMFLPVSERAILNKIADIIDANTEHLAMVESLDNGKPIRETMAIDVPLSAKHFRYFAGLHPR